MQELPVQNSIRLPPGPPPAYHLHKPPAELIQPATSDHHARDDIDQTDHEAQEAAALLAHEQHDRLDVVLEEDPRDVVRVLGDGVRLAGHGVLVREDDVLVPAHGLQYGGGVGVVFVDDAPFPLGVDGGDDRDEVLVFVVVVFGRGDGLVERVQEGWVVRAEGQFGDHVGEVECCCVHTYVS